MYLSITYGNYLIHHLIGTQLNQLQSNSIANIAFYCFENFIAMEIMQKSDID